MAKRKGILRFFIIAAVLYCFFLIIMFMGGKNYYQQALSLINEPSVNAILKKDSVQFREIDNTDSGEFDTKVRIINKESIREARRALRQAGKTAKPVDVRFIKFNSLRSGYLPTIFVLTLIIATPFTRYRRKLFALFAGFILINLFISFKFYIWILQTNTGFETMSIFGQKFISGLVYIFILDMPMRVIVPVLIWLLVSFRVSDYRGFVANLRPKE